MLSKLIGFLTLIVVSANFRQEIDRMQKVIKRVQSSLSDLKLAIDGTIVMSPALKESLDAMYDARIPESWMKVTIVTFPKGILKNFFDIDFMGIHYSWFLVHRITREEFTILYMDKHR